MNKLSGEFSFLSAWLKDLKDNLITETSLVNEAN